MSDIKSLLLLARDTASLALDMLRQLEKENIKQYTFSTLIPHEIKAQADVLIEKLIIEKLSSSKLSILSEESGMLKGEKQTALRFIIDPLDGTVNFVRGLSNCSISIALYDGDIPIFGVLASYPTGDISWGGRGIGSFINDKKLEVSSIYSLNKAVLCTGFPSRFDFNDNKMQSQIDLMASFFKIRMLGAASQSLLMVAKGAAECYSEMEIMLWDVAAGIAIVEGANGRIISSPGQSELSLNVRADNGVIKYDYQ